MEVTFIPKDTTETETIEKPEVAYYDDNNALFCFPEGRDKGFAMHLNSRDGEQFSYLSCLDRSYFKASGLLKVRITSITLEEI